MAGASRLTDDFCVELMNNHQGGFDPFAISFVCSLIANAIAAEQVALGSNFDPELMEARRTI